jgi:hypothetical protein
MPTYQEIVYTFNQNLSTNQKTNLFTISPTTPGKAVVKGKTLTFIPNQPLTNSGSYITTLSNITDKKGRSISSITTTFKTTYIPMSELPASVTQRYVSQQDSSYDAQTPINKLKASLPYKTSQYTLTYNGSFTVQVISPDVSGSENAANAYIKSFGVDPTTLGIYYAIPAVFSGKPGP